MVSTTIKYLKFVYQKLNPRKEKDFIFVTNKNLFFIKEILYYDGNFINQILNPTEELKKLAVSSNGFAIQYIKKPSEEICLAAIYEQPLSFEYIKKPSKEVCLKAATEIPSLLRLIKKPNRELLEPIITQKAWGLEFIKDTSVLSFPHYIYHFDECSFFAIQPDNEWLFSFKSKNILIPNASKMEFIDKIQKLERDNHITHSSLAESIHLAHQITN